jgi:preprotein translocase subunit SecF
MEIFKNTNFDFLGRKLPFLGLSLVLMAASAVSLVSKGGPRFGIDFTGGAKMYIKFASTPDEERIRAALRPRIEGEILVQRIVGSNEVIVDTDALDDAALEAVRENANAALREAFGDPAGAGKPDFHAVGTISLAESLVVPLQSAGVPLSTDDLRELSQQITSFRDTPPRSGLIGGFDELSAVPGVTPQILNVIKQEFSLSSFVVRSFEKVGPKIGAELRQQAINAVLFALGGMLVYIALRFEFVYGLAAVLAVIHDTFVTIGLFSLFDKEVSLTVVAALLTLVGYSMNDTIVIFDRVRENLRTARREPLQNIINTSINQTLARTAMTSGLTFMTVLALWLFGGETLNGFSFCLVVGILVGTYSSVFIASPIVIWWNNWRGGVRAVAPAGAPAEQQPVAAGAKPKRREKAKAGR